jgi:hypothetical protein
MGGEQRSDVVARRLADGDDSKSAGHDILLTRDRPGTTPGEEFHDP